MKITIRILEAGDNLDDVAGVLDKIKAFIASNPDIQVTVVFA